MLPNLYSPVPTFPNPFLPRRGMPYVSQYICSPVHLLPSSYVLRPLWSPVPTFHRSDFPSLSYPYIFPSPYVPRYLCFPDPFLRRTPILIFPRTVSSAYSRVLNSQTRLTINAVEKIPGVLLLVAIDIVYNRCSTIKFSVISSKCSFISACSTIWDTRVCSPKMFSSPYAPKSLLSGPDAP